jgi:hypothetical protein
MEEMSEQDRQARDGARARRKRIVESATRVIGLLAVSFWLLVFLVVLRTGYLSGIGIGVGVLYLTPGLVAPLAGLAGKRRLEAFLSWLHTGQPLLVALVVGLVSVWPERDEGSWRSLSFDHEVAAAEAQRAVPDEENAAFRYEAALVGVDVNDRPGFISRAGHAYRGLAGISWKSEDYPQAAQWLDLQTEVLGKLLQIGEIEKCRWPVYANSDCRWTVPYRKVSYAVWLLTVATLRDLGEDRSQQALEKCLCLLRIADHSSQQTHDVDFRGAFRVERTALEMLRHLLIGRALSQQDLEIIARRLPTAADTWPQDTARLLAFNELRFAQFLAPIYEISGEGEIRFAASFRRLDDGRRQWNSVARRRAWRLYWFMNMPLDPEGVWDMARQESAALGHFLQQGPASCAAHANDEPFGSTLDFMADTVTNLARCWAHDSCFPEWQYANFAQYYAEQMAQRRGTWLVFGLRRYHDAHGAWPQTLDAISEYVPAETFVDPTGSEGFVYVLDGDSLRLYSRGLNRLDEGGRRRYVKALDKVEDDIWIWPPPVPAAHDDEPPDDEMMKQLERAYGKNYVETHFKNDGSKKQ